MKGYTIVVNGKTYQVDICERDTEGGAPVMSAPVAVASAPAAVVAAPVAAPVVAASNVPAGEGDITAPMPGTIFAIAVNVGDVVAEGDLILTIEAMKMENELVAPVAGTVQKVVTSKGAAINTGDLLVVIG